MYKKENKTSPEFLASLNYFRAVSILFIVMGHSYGIAGIHADSLFEKVVVNIITGGTTLFVFISGFLFHHIFYAKFRYRKFIASKTKNVLIPYLLLSIPIVAWFIMKNDGSSPFFSTQGSGIVNEYLTPIFKYYWTGGAMIAYWYIPFIMITFAIAPLHILFIHQKITAQTIVIVLLVISAALIHRPLDNYSVFQSVVYFSPVYLIGIFCSINKELIYRLMKNKETYLFTIVVGLAVLETVTGHNGNYHKEPFLLNGIDIMFFQKITLSLFFMIFLHRFENSSNNLLNKIAATSFGIFFLHGYLIYILSRYFSNTNIVNITDLVQAGQLSSWFILITITAVFVTISSMVVLTTKNITPKYSRYLTGY